MVVPFIILLLTSVVIAFISWRNGNSASGYLCLSFFLPFLAIPIAVLLDLVTTVIPKFVNVVLLD